MLLIQSSGWARELKESGHLGMLSRMMSLEALLEAWKCILRSERFFQSWASWFQRSLTLVCPERAKAHPSLWLFTPSGSPLVLVKDGFPKRGYLSISALLVGSSLVRPGRTLIHAPRMLFHMEQGVATPLWPSVGVKPNTWKSWRLGVFRDSRMFRARQQGEKHLALGRSWCHWKGLET
jgi:hypothetical protein